MGIATVNPVAGRRESLFFGAAALLAVLTYLYGLGNVGIPANGDENVYLHIARKTAESGHWLPLATDIEGVRNTKPPFLFWQAIASTSGGADWTLWRLRLPSVLYSIATAALLCALLRHLRHQWRVALLASVVYLAFYSTYRYGRPLLTDAPEVFWLALPGIAVLWTRGALLDSKWLPGLLFGVVVGIACLYKSFALVVPFCLTVAGWHLDRHGYRIRESIARATPVILISCVVALALFAIWPLLDPDPGAIWRDFVLRENAGKFAAGAGAVNYLKSFLWGEWSVWSLFGALLANGGLLAPILLVLTIDAWRRRHSLSSEERLLWIWVIAYFIAYAIPSQRSGRYLFPAMPALAALAALAWPRLPRLAFVTTVALATALAGAFAFFSILTVRQAGGDLRFSAAYWLVIVAALVLGGVSLAVPRFSPSTAPLLAILLLLAMGSSLTSYAAPPGPYTAATRERLRGEAVFIPCNFLASEEAHRFLLPGADIRSYAEEDGLTADALAARYRFFAALVPLDQTPRCEGCRVLDERYVVRARHTATIADQKPVSQVVRQFFAREVLFESTRAPISAPPYLEACAR
jgi:4-amino-4-deoxy-L-arabinose transferase-like glycosyltransferase